METKNIILKLRTERGMSQDELADKIMVTRQAVSRWENGDTIPNTDTLKLLSKEFDVSINTLLGEPRKLICQCCGMPIDDDSILGRDKDGTLNDTGGSGTEEKKYGADCRRRPRRLGGGSYGSGQRT